MKILIIYNGTLYKNLHETEQKIVDQYTTDIVDFLTKTYPGYNEIIKLTCVGDQEISRCIVSFVGKASATTKAEVYSALWSNGFANFIPQDSLLME